MANYGFGLAIARSRQTAENQTQNVYVPRRLLICALIFNLLPLLWFKYSWFFIQNMALLFHASWLFTPPALPPGISFYTFIQIAWLVGIYRGSFSPNGIFRHCLFSGSFMWVLSGPIVRYEQMGWQLDNPGSDAALSLARGFSLFCIGLAKKTLLADNIGFYADLVFNAAEKAWPISGPEAWAGSLCYSFQLYFDFSGYTDMAIGLGLMAGLRLPENFNSPYKASGIIDFWRRWHMTLGSWLRDFLYIPLGGNRKGKTRQYCNLFLTMLLGGAWHGAGWTYIIWGALHGFMLCANHLFRTISQDHLPEKLLRALPSRLIFIIFTFLCIDLCWVVFRAFSMEGALRVYKAMFLGPWISVSNQPNASVLNEFFPNNYLADWRPFALLAFCAAICWLLPNSSEIMNRRCQGVKKFLNWRPARAWATIMAVLAFVSLLGLGRQTTFLYFQF